MHRSAVSASAAVSGWATLTPTERELLTWVAAGHSNAEIARLRGRSPATVRNQLHSAFTKLGVSTRTQAVRILYAKN